MFLKICKQTFHISHVCIFQKVKGVLMWNIQHIKTKILADFQFCISVPLIDNLLLQFFIFKTVRWCLSKSILYQHFVCLFFGFGFFCFFVFCFCFFSCLGQLLLWIYILYIICIIHMSSRSTKKLKNCH